MRADRPLNNGEDRAVPGLQTGSARSQGSVVIKLSGWLIILLLKWNDEKILNFTNRNLGLSHTWASWPSHQTWTNFQTACLLNEEKFIPSPAAWIWMLSKRRKEERTREGNGVGKKKDKDYVSSHMWNVCVRVCVIWEKMGDTRLGDGMGGDGKTSRSKVRCSCVQKCRGETVIVYAN